MLSRRSYPDDHVDRCRQAMADGITAFRTTAEPPPDGALDALETAYARNLVISLDAWFVHRMRGAEGKDGNPLNEVRLLVESLIDHNGTYTPDAKIRRDPESSILGLDAGDAIAPTIDDVERLVEAFLDEITTRYPDEGGSR